MQSTDVDEATFVDLVRRASNDATALEQLRTVGSVEGQPVDVAALLDGADGPSLDARLAELERAWVDGSGTSADAATVRQQAGEILADDKFQQSETPKPLEGFVNWVGERVQWLLDRFAPVTENSLAQWALAASALGLLVAVTAVLLRRGLRGRQPEGRRPAIAEDIQGLDPETLDRQAAELEQRGELTQAIRLQFAAGVLRLDRSGAIEYRPSMTMGELRRTVTDPTFDAEAGLFEQVLYGDRVATSQDVEASRSRWTSLTGTKASR